MRVKSPENLKKGAIGPKIVISNHFMYKKVASRASATALQRTSVANIEL
jgi:hypothetical protein